MTILGPNWKTTASAAATALMAAITFLSGISYDMGPIALVIPPRFKPTIALIAGSCTLILWVINGYQQKSKNVTGGSQQQTIGGGYVEDGKQDLVDATVKASPPEEKAAAAAVIKERTT